MKNIQGLSSSPPDPKANRTGQERRQTRGSGPEGAERRVSAADRRTEKNDEYVSFFVAKQLLGIPVSQVQEILPQRSSTRVPTAPKAISGILNLRGQIVTTIDLRERLGVAPRIPGEEHMSVVVHHDSELFSLLVDSVGDVIPVSKTNFTDAPPTLDNVWRDCCDGVYRLQQGLLVVLNISSILDFSIYKSAKGSDAL